MGAITALSLAVLLAAQVSHWNGSARLESDELPGIDLTGLTAAQRDTLLSRAAHERCPCPCGFTLFDCRHKDLTCPLSGPILKNWVRDYRAEQHATAQPKR